MNFYLGILDIENTILLINDSNNFVFNVRNVYKEQEFL